MQINTNSWNKIRYTVHSFYYDLLLLVLRKEREKALMILSPQASASILIVGAGTGLDLPYLKGDFEITATDITPAMLKKLKNRAESLKLRPHIMVMDGQDLEFEDDVFDYVILNLILAVIPDPKKCIMEVQRVLKPGGRIIVFDKFLEDSSKTGTFRKIVNVFSNILFSDINRKFSEILSVTDLKIDYQQPSLLGGMFMIYRLTKTINH